MSILDFLAEALANGNGPQPDQTPQPSTPQGDNIIVSANRPQPVQQSRPMAYPDAPPAPTLSNGPTPPDLGNRSYAEMAQAAVNNNGKPKSHLHQILDNIGDAFLIANGKDPMHRQHADEDQAKAALAGFTQNPLAAMERLNAVGGKYSDAATALFNEYQKNQLTSQLDQNLMASRTDQALNRQNDNLTALQNYAARLVHAANGDPAKTAYALQVIGQRANLLHVPLETLGLSSGMTPEQLALYGQGDMTVNQQEMMPIRQQTANASTENAHAHMINATRPHPAAAHQTDLEHYQVINQPGYKKTTADQAWERKYLHGTRTSLLDSLGVAPPEGAPARTQGWSVKRN